MKAPAFWYDEDSFFSKLLNPLGSVYRAAGKLRRKITSPFRASIPVICVGNVVAGGSGKTPTTIAIVKLLKQHGASPVIVSRGYGGQHPGPLRVDPALHDARVVGDEALLLAQVAPCWIGRNKAAVTKAAEAGATHIIMDDGLQNPTVAHDLSFLVLDGITGLGNGKLIPAGPLRETLRDALQRVTAVVMIGDDRHNLARVINKPIFRADVFPCLPKDFPSDAKFLAFAGIARPNKFYTSCNKACLNITSKRDFADHHFFKENELKEIEQDAKAQGAQLLTTAKDWVRLPDEMRRKTNVLPIDLVFHDDSILDLLYPETTAPRTPS